MDLYKINKRLETLETTMMSLSRTLGALDKKITEYPRSFISNFAEYILPGINNSMGVINQQVVEVREVVQQQSALFGQLGGSIQSLQNTLDSPKLTTLCDKIDSSDNVKLSLLGEKTDKMYGKMEDVYALLGGNGIPLPPTPFQMGCNLRKEKGRRTEFLTALGEMQNRASFCKPLKTKPSASGKRKVPSASGKRKKSKKTNKGEQPSTSKENQEGGATKRKAKRRKKPSEANK
jgi:hypothetical protein